MLSNADDRGQSGIGGATVFFNTLQNIATYIRHRITNAASESINSKIQWVKDTARRFGKYEELHCSIHFHCGGLDLMPATH